MSRPRVLVTDHALVRYLDRVCGLPVEELRAEIAALVEAKVEGLGPGETRLVEAAGAYYVLRAGALVTVVPCGAAKRRRRRVRGELREGDPREPGARPATEADPWWWAMAGGREG